MVKTDDVLITDKAAMAELLHAHGIAPTSQRVEIATVMLSASQHLSADQVLVQLVESGAAVSKATVYNTLRLFVENDLISQVIVDSTKVFYDSNVEPHYHFYNVDDGTLTDLNTAKFPLERLPTPPEGTYAESVDIIVRVRNNT